MLRRLPFRGASAIVALSAAADGIAQLIVGAVLFIQRLFVSFFSGQQIRIALYRRHAAVVSVRQCWAVVCRSCFLLLCSSAAAVRSAGCCGSCSSRFRLSSLLCWRVYCRFCGLYCWHRRVEAVLRLRESCFGRFYRAAICSISPSRLSAPYAYRQCSPASASAGLAFLQRRCAGGIRCLIRLDAVDRNWRCCSAGD